MITRFILLILLLVASLSVRAATIIAASASEADLSTAVTGASNGDTILIPDGTGVFTSSLVVSKAVSIQAQHFGSVTWIDAIAGRTGYSNLTPPFRVRATVTNFWALTFERQTQSRRTITTALSKPSVTVRRSGLGT
jgi:hypothetical protein